MRRSAPFLPEDLDALGEFFDTTGGVVAMREIHRGNRDPRVIGLRHDVDNHPKALDTAVALAHWEAERGYRSTYFLLHTARYWRDGRWKAAALEMADLGHEIGLHLDAIASCLEKRGGDPFDLVDGALDEMRMEGLEVIGVVAHGNRPVCVDANFANDELFLECVRPQNGAPDRELTYHGRTVKLAPRSLADFDLEYESIGLRQYTDAKGTVRTRPNQLYNTDSGGEWYYPFEDTIREFRGLIDGQLHLLLHPDWWHEAFVTEEVAA